MHIFFSGIGGAGIGPLALIAKQAGYEVSGSDKQDSSYIQYLRSHGIERIEVGQSEDKIAAVHSSKPIDWYVYSSALEKENPNHPEFLFVRSKGIKSSKRAEFLNRLLREKNLKLIAIAGTHGKTTTTAMVAHLLRVAGLRATEAGNIGRPLCDIALSRDQYQWLAVEVSSFQLHDSPAFAPEIGVLTNLAPDHLDRYPSVDAYYDDKRLLFRNAAAESVWVLNADDPAVRLKGLEKEVSSLMSEVNDIRSKNDKAEKFDATALDRLETAVAELNTRVETALQQTASARGASGAVASSAKKKKKKGKLFGLFGGGEDKYSELTGAPAPGRDRVLFEEAAKEVRKNNYDTGRLLFATIINTYPDSPFLPLAKLAIADSFYLEGTTSALIQAAQAYQDWLTFFPTDPLADDASLKVAEAEMRQMGLSDRDISHARKAEQRLKVLLQQYPQSPLRPTVESRLREVQENLAMHNLQIARFYYDIRYSTGKGGLKGSHFRLKEIVDKYPWAAVSLTKAFEKAKQICYQRVVNPRIVPLASRSGVPSS